MSLILASALAFQKSIFRIHAAAAAKSVQLCLTLCDPVDGSPPGSSVPGILQARILEWVAISFSRGSSLPRNQTQVSRIVSKFLFKFNLHLQTNCWITLINQSILG